MKFGAGLHSWFVFTRRILESPVSTDDRKRDALSSDTREHYGLESSPLRAGKHLERTALIKRLIQNLWCQI